MSEGVASGIVRDSFGIRSRFVRDACLPAAAMRRSPQRSLLGRRQIGFPIAFIQIYFKYRTGSSIVYVISLLYIRVFLRRRGRAAGGYGQIWIPDYGDPRPYFGQFRRSPTFWHSFLQLRLASSYEYSYRRTSIMVRVRITVVYGLPPGVAALVLVVASCRDQR